MVHLETLMMRVLYKKVHVLQLPWVLGILAGFPLLLAWTACSWSHSQLPYKPGQIFDAKTKQVISFEQLKTQILNAEVVYIGEAHYTPSHIQAALTVLNMLVKEGRKPSLAMEMFGWDGQKALDGYVNNEYDSEEQFLQDARWKKNWGGEYNDYRPLPTFSREHRLPLYALNPPKQLVRLVASKGLIEALKDPSMNQWGIPKDMSLEDPEYRKIIFPQIRDCHPGHPDEVYQPFYEASIFRDEGMAQVIKNYLKKKSPESGPLVSYTGGGHIQYRVPVPNRVKKSQPGGFKDVLIYLIALDPSQTEDIEESMNTHLADYLWLTELGPRGTQPRCG